MTSHDFLDYCLAVPEGSISVVVPDGGTTVASGNFIAAGHGSGATVLLKGAFPNLNAPALASIILEGADCNTPIGDPYGGITGRPTADQRAPRVDRPTTLPPCGYSSGSKASRILASAVPAATCPRPIWTGKYVLLNLPSAYAARRPNMHPDCQSTSPKTARPVPIALLMARLRTRLGSISSPCT